MSKSIYEQAVEKLNKYRNQNYNSTDKDEVELAYAIDIILTNYVKQKKLLELYKEVAMFLTTAVEDDEDTHAYTFANINNLKEQILELENE